MAEIRRLVWRLVWGRQPAAAFVPAWSGWRRTHQAAARICHYNRRGAVPLDLQL